jgi:hypothetical protein
MCRVVIMCVFSSADDSLNSAQPSSEHFYRVLKFFTVSEFLLNRNWPGSAVRDIELGKNEGQGML